MRRASWIDLGGWSLLAVFALGGGLLGDIYSGSVSLGGRDIHRVSLWQGLYVTGFAGYLLLLASYRRRCRPHPKSSRPWPGSGRLDQPVSTRTILLGAILLRLPLLLAAPNDDCNRYAWEGRIQNLGFNPYVLSPESRQLEPYRDEIWTSINKKHYTTIYPPLAQLEFRLLSAIHYGVKTPQIAHTVVDMTVVIALAALLSLLGRPSWYLAVYALCPLVLASFAHAGHNDSLMILAMIAFLAAARKKRWTMAGLALGLAILAKTVPAVLLVLLVRRSRRALVIAMVTAAFGYLIYIDAGWGLFRTLHDFPSQGHFNSLFDELRIPLNQWLGRRLTAGDRNRICLVLLACAAGYRAARPRDLITDARWLMALVVLMLPIIHFWYITWVLVFVAARPRGYWSWLVLTGTMAWYWRAEWARQTCGHWTLEAWVVAAIAVPFFTAWIIETLWGKMSMRMRDKG